MFIFMIMVPAAQVKAFVFMFIFAILTPFMFAMTVAPLITRLCRLVTGRAYCCANGGGDVIAL